jgi:hypothetical protein
MASQLIIHAFCPGSDILVLDAHRPASEKKFQGQAGLGPDIHIFERNRSNFILLSGLHGIQEDT